MKTINALFLLGTISILNAVDCDSKYDNSGCSEALFSLGSEMEIKQYRVIYDEDQDKVSDSRDKCLGTPAKLKVDKDGCHIVAKVELSVEKEELIIEDSEPLMEEIKVVTLRLNFETSKYDILEDSFSKVDDFAEFLLAYPQYNAKIVGHTDSMGSYKSNIKLSLNRAKAVFNMLVSNNIEKSRLSVDGVGPDEPIATNDTLSGRAENRRIEVILTKAEEN
ncbi:MAG: OmpA family protein [Campylobacterota bacterium]|nr:OmpA family protein [Campylobacterota bacterium]